MKYLLILMFLIGTSSAWACDSHIDTTDDGAQADSTWDNIGRYVLDSIHSEIWVRQSEKSELPTITISAPCTLWLENIDSIRIIVKPKTPIKGLWWEDSWEVIDTMRLPYYPTEPLILDERFYVAP